jgi:hypothetical protein
MRYKPASTITGILPLHFEKRSNERGRPEQRSKQKGSESVAKTQYDQDHLTSRLRLSPLRNLGVRQNCLINTFG